jgi:gluconate 2-dehydrogenase gamma chain
MNSISRRNMLRATAAAGSAAVVSWFAPREAHAAHDSLLPPPVTDDRYVFFTPDEVAFVDAAVSRLIPADELGPGAKEAHVTFFIDQQMDGAFGRGESWYMQGPFKEGEKEQGYQLKLVPSQLYRVAIKAADDYCRGKFGKPFAELADADRDTVLHGLEGGDIHLDNAPAKEFFALLWQNTQEGFFADPIYGGNRAFAGWKLVGFPGPRYNYVSEIEQFGKAYDMPVVGLAGRSGTAEQRGV